ncbi:hypothetical protein [Paracoccus sp. N5]|uniref:hypothetical protein n=1 Tax=Paracoccus sp. N5 TaxID=1101189 RepID=UPI0012FA1850|nr:hypothetical protein [Paracoccus sp. N5]
MARDRRDIAKKDGAAQTAAVPSASPGPAVSASPASPTDKALAGNRGLSEDRDLFRHFLRALARDAARRDHAADPH